MDEWDLSPEFPNQVAPLPPERQTITSERRGFCRSNPDYAESSVMVLSHEYTPLFSYRRGYLFQVVQMIPAGTEIEVTGESVETGVCDMWRVDASWPNPDYIPPSEPTEEDILYGGAISISGYVFGVQTCDRGPGNRVRSRACLKTRARREPPGQGPPGSE